MKTTPYLLLLALLAGCGDGSGPAEPDPDPDPEPIVPVAELPATFEGDLNLFDRFDQLNCRTPASFTVSEDGSGSYVLPGGYTYPDPSDQSTLARGCRNFFGLVEDPSPDSGTFTGAWVASDTLEFHIHGGGGCCLYRFHPDSADTWRAYVVSDSMRFVRQPWPPNTTRYFEFEGVRR